MAVSTRLKAYLALERAMVELDRDGDALADMLRDRMDPIWYALSPDERALLDAREGDPLRFAGTLQPNKLGFAKE